MRNAYLCINLEHERVCGHIGNVCDYDILKHDEFTRKHMFYSMAPITMMMMRTRILSLIWQAWITYSFKAWIWGIQDMFSLFFVKTQNDRSLHDSSKQRQERKINKEICIECYAWNVMESLPRDMVLRYVRPLKANSIVKRLTKLLII